MREQYCNKFKRIWFMNVSNIQHGRHISIPQTIQWEINFESLECSFSGAFICRQICLFRCLCVWIRKIYCWTLDENENETFSLLTFFVLIVQKMVSETLNRSIFCALWTLHLSWRVSSSSIQNILEIADFTHSSL